jgi:hypothetical protein
MLWLLLLVVLLLPTLQKRGLAVQLTGDEMEWWPRSGDARCRQLVPGKKQAKEPTWDPADPWQEEQTCQDKRDRCTYRSKFHE